jgi:hypothetical protein
VPGDWWLFWHEVVLISARPKNCENQRDDDDLIDAMVEFRGRRIDTSKRTIWVCPTYVLDSRGWVVVLAGSGFKLCQSEKLRKIKENIMI